MFAATVHQSTTNYPQKIQDIDCFSDDPNYLIQLLKRSDLTIGMQGRVIETLISDHKLTRAELSRRTGMSEALLSARRLLIRLDGRTLGYFEDGKLPCTQRAIKSLLHVPSEIRLQLVEKSIKHGQVKTRQIEELCRPYMQQVEKPSQPISATQQASNVISQKPIIPLSKIRDSVWMMCGQCEAREEALIPEPAWQMLHNAIDSTCADCGMQEFPKICTACPFPVFVKELLKQN